MPEHDLVDGALEAHCVLPARCVRITEAGASLCVLVVTTAVCATNLLGVVGGHVDSLCVLAHEAVGVGPSRTHQLACVQGLASVLLNRIEFKLGVDHGQMATVVNAHFLGRGARIRGVEVFVLAVVVCCSHRVSWELGVVAEAPAIPLLRGRGAVAAGNGFAVLALEALEASRTFGIAVTHARADRQVRTGLNQQRMARCATWAEPHLAHGVRTDLLACPGVGMAGAAGLDKMARFGWLAVRLCSALPQVAVLGATT